MSIEALKTAREALFAMQRRLVRATGAESPLAKFALDQLDAALAAPSAEPVAYPNWMPFALTLEAALSRGEDPSLLVDENSPLRDELRRLIRDQREAVGAPDIEACARNAIHYPECWDTAAYPTVWAAMGEVYAAFSCTNQDTHAPIQSRLSNELSDLYSMGFSDGSKQADDPETNEQRRAAAINLVLGRLTAAAPSVEAEPVPGQGVMLNGLTEAETSATASCAGLSGEADCQVPAQAAAGEMPPLPEPDWWAEEHGTGKRGRRGIYREQQALLRDSRQSEFFGLYTLETLRDYARSCMAAAPNPQPMAGWQLVPVEPTDAMLEAAEQSDREYSLRNFGEGQTVMQGPWDHWVAMIAAAPKGPVPDAWQPIETAPRDGTHFLGYRRGTVAEAYFVPRDDCEMWAFGRQSGAYEHWPEVRPTHWMPLPAAPKQEQATVEGPKP